MENELVQHIKWLAFEIQVGVKITPKVQKLKKRTALF